MPIDPARALDAYVRAHTYLAHRPPLVPEPEPDADPAPHPDRAERAADPTPAEAPPQATLSKVPAARRRSGLLARLFLGVGRRDPEPDTP